MPAPEDLELDDLHHVARVPLPWRDSALTECGLPAGKYPTITPAELAAKRKKLGSTRAAMSTCMTCWQTTRGHSFTRDDDAILEAIAREIERTRWAKHAEDRDRIRHEITAAAILIDAHRDEFDALLAALGQATSIDVARMAKRRRG